MPNSKQHNTLSSIILFAFVAIIVSAGIGFGGRLLSVFLEFAQPQGSEFAGWKAIPLVAFAIGCGIVSERLSFGKSAAITILLLIVWYIASVLGNQFFNIDLLFLPVLLIALIGLFAMQIKKYWEIDSKFSEKLTLLTSSQHLIEGKSPELRVESALMLLRTVLPLSEVIIFQFENDGSLNPVGRTRAENGNDSLSSRQNAWRKNVELCEKALYDREIVIETDEENAGSARIALPLINENTVVGVLFVEIREDFEAADKYLLEAFGEQLARDFQRKRLIGELESENSYPNFLSTRSQEHRMNIVDQVNGLIKEQSYGVIATSYIKEAHAIAYLDGTISYVNKPMRRLAKLDPREMHNINLFDLLGRFKTDIFNEPSMAIRRVMQTGSTFECELLFPEDELTLDLEITLVKIAGNIENVHDTEIPKKPACFLITIRDVTTRKENEKLRSDLVNLMSHELRTPITSIQGFAEMLMLEEGLSGESREYLSIISNESQRAANLLSNFLSVSKLQQGDKQEFQRSPVEVNKVVEEVVDNMTVAAKKKRIRLVEKNSQQLPPIAADRGLLTKAISHLVDNAVKYSPERSSVIISTILESDFLRVEVEDRGYGIPPAEQEKVWNKFYRVAREGQDKGEESTGLGLSLVKEIIERHSGTVGVESEVGRGSKFSFRIPRL
ncbi:MAG: GAF domain-containing protein [Acidobacteria bacterium]|nr:GAF domain-containing protein [Acidobacteriota bacterium]